MKTKNVKKILVATDNAFLLKRFRQIVESPEYEPYGFDFICEKSSMEMFRDEIKSRTILPLTIKDNAAHIIGSYDLFISLHCKQLFPPSIVNALRCINVHPGLNPFNRGWYPQVFSIINKMPHGATIHEIDEQLDHGPIICQREVAIHEWDTSLTVYNRVQEAELQLLIEYLPAILSGSYAAQPMPHEGNLNLKKDFKKLLKIDRQKPTTFGDAIDYLRALSHGTYRNAYFETSSGEKVYVNLSLERATE